MNAAGPEAPRGAVSPERTSPSRDPRSDSLEYETIRLFEMDFANITYFRFCELIAGYIAQGKRGYIVTPNVDHVCRYHKDGAFRAAYDGALLRVADGMPLIWASQWVHRPLIAKLSGSDLVVRLSEFAAREGLSVFYFGAAEGVAEEVARRMMAQYPGLRVAGVYCPPMGFDRKEETNAAALRAVSAAKPDLCLVALGSPRQELWIGAHFERLEARIAIGIGAGLDFAAGRVKRAPAWMQYRGLEWLWRLVQEPGRLWRRYLIDGSLFMPILLREWFRRA